MGVLKSAYIVFILIFIIAVSASAPAGSESIDTKIIIPRDYFLGLSSPSTNLSQAKNDALFDVAKQIMLAIGGTYDIKSESRMFHKTTHNNEEFSKVFKEHVLFKGSGFISQVNNNIVESSYERTPDGYVYKVLVYFPKEKMERLIRLSKGAKVLVRSLGDGTVELREVNGVGVVITEAEYVIDETNNHASFYNYYVMKVSSGGRKTVREVLAEPVVLKSRSKVIKLMVPNSNRVKDLLLGTDRSVYVSLLGRDEVGRIVRVKVVLR